MPALDLRVFTLAVVAHLAVSRLLTFDPHGTACNGAWDI